MFNKLLNFKSLLSYWTSNFVSSSSLTCFRFSKIYGLIRQLKMRPIRHFFFCFCFRHFFQFKDHIQSFLKLIDLLNTLLNVYYRHFTDYSTFSRISLLAYSPLAMGLLSGKYFSSEGGPADARLNLYRGLYKMLPHVFFSDIKCKGNCYKFIRCGPFM